MFTGQQSGALWQSCAYSCLVLRLWRSSCMQRTVIAPAVANTLLRVCRVSHAWQRPGLALPGGSPAVLRPTPATAHTVRHRCRSSSTPPVTCMHMHMCPSQVTRQALCVYEHRLLRMTLNCDPPSGAGRASGCTPHLTAGSSPPGSHLQRMECEGMAAVRLATIYTPLVRMPARFPHARPVLRVRTNLSVPRAAGPSRSSSLHRPGPPTAFDTAAPTRLVSVILGCAFPASHTGLAAAWPTANSEELAPGVVPVQSPIRALFAAGSARPC